jgi:uncharacterized protein YndB with AHSA1/START domain
MSDCPIAFTVEQTMSASASAIFRAWTEEFDSWFAAPGAIRMEPAEGQPYWFETIHAGERHPHYGRFLVLQPVTLIEQTWVTGRNGTEGAETVVRIELVAYQSGTGLRLTHSGFANEESAKNHRDSWPAILHHLDQTLAASR